MQETKWLSEEALQIAEKRREAKDKGEMKHIHLNSEFQIIASRDKNAFLSDQCKEIEESNRLGKTRDLYMKIWDTKGKNSYKDKHNKGQKQQGPNKGRRLRKSVK